MGLNSKSDVAFLAAAGRLGVSYDATLQVGRQTLATDVSIRRALREAGTEHSGPAIERDGFAEGLFRLLGATTVESIDASDWEGATIVHDLNEPLPAALRRRYSAVFDGGTLEHVFEVTTALRSCLDAVRLGGHFLAITAANNLCGHGFYQLSPEIYFSFLTSAGFEVQIALIRAMHPAARWYIVPDPRRIGRRVDVHGMLFAQLLYVSARRTRIVDLDAIVPQQSDYETAWAGRTQPSRVARIRRALPVQVRPPARAVVRGYRSVRSLPLLARDMRSVRLADLR